MTLARRSFLGALLCAPAIIRTPGILMPVRPLRSTLTLYPGDYPTIPVEGGITRESLTRLIEQITRSAVIEARFWVVSPPMYEAMRRAAA